MSAKTVTQLLVDWRGGDGQALEQLTPLIYRQLVQIAQGYMNAERPDHTLQATALVHEAFAQLVDADLPWQDRSHFFGIAARVMRRILVDHARSRGRNKRGGDAVALTLNEGLQMQAEPDPIVLDLDQALSDLAAFDQRKSEVVELHYFGGLTYEQIAQVLEVSPATVNRELHVAKAWLHAELSAP